MRKGLKENQILVLIKEPGKPARVEPLFDNTLEAFQQAVGGYIETVTIATDAVIICNEEGRLLALPHNCRFCGIDLCGPILIAGYSGDEFTSLSAETTGLLMRGLAELDLK